MKKTLRTETRIARAAFAAMLLGTPGAVFAQFIEFPGGTYTQNFDGLATNQNIAISNTSQDGPFPLSDLSWAGSQPYSNVGVNGWQIYETGGTSFAAFSVNDGTSTTSFSFSYGSLNSTDRALGVLGGNARIMAIGAAFKNTYGSPITSLTISYTGEQWRLGRTGAGADTFTFGYKVGAGMDISGTFAPFASLNFVTPVTTGIIGALDGNDPANRTFVSAELTGFNWAPDEYLVLRWRDANDAGNDHGMGIDDLTVVGPPVIPEPSSLAVLGLGLAALITRRKGCKG